MRPNGGAIGNRWGEQPAAGAARGVSQLFGTMNHMADLRPIHQVFTVKNRKAPGKPHKTPIPPPTFLYLSLP